MPDLQEYKCPCCGGAIAFDSKLQKMKCPYCDTEFEMETLRQYDEEISKDKEGSMEWNTDALTEWSEQDGEGMKIYSCQSCGGEIVADENAAASFCPFCNNPIVMKGSIQGHLKPDYIIPFKLDKKAAMDMFAKHLKGKKLLPKVFREQNHMEEIKGMYVPYWLFDTKASARMHYKATKLRFWSDARYDYTETSFYAVKRKGDISFQKVPVDGSSKMADDMMESLEPFDFKQAVPFQSAYFAGYYADKYDVDDKAAIERANERVKNSTESKFMDSVKGYTSVVPDGGSINLSDSKVSYAMYPVWMLTTKWKEQLYIFAMNGQTGKFVGDLPVDKSLAKKYFGKAFLITTAVIYALLALIWLI